MSNVPQAIVTLVESSSTMTALIEDRIYPSVLPHDAQVPAMTFNKVAGTGGRTTGPDLVMTRIQFDIYDDSYLTVETVGQALYTLLHRYSGTSDSVVFTDAQLDYMQNIYDDDANMYRCLMDFKFWSIGL